MLSFTRRVLSKFHRLQWRLTFSYTLITAIALLVTIVVATLVLIQFVINQYPQNAYNTLLAESPVVIHDLRMPFNHQNLINDVMSVDNNLQATYTDPNTDIIATIPTQKGCTVIINPKGRVLASSDTTVIPEGGPFSTRLPPAGISLVLTLSHTNANSKPIVSVDHNQMLYAAMPLFDHQRQFIGILLTTQKLPNYGQVVLALFPLLWPTLALITVIVGIVGVLFGSIMSRWLVRRFKKVTQATENWSQGDFSSVISDNSVDELGVMTRQLNTMAGKLERLLREQQNIAVLEERNRMARDLHDSLKQQLFAVIMQVWSAQALLDTNISATKERLATIEQQLGQAQQELSQLIHQLRPLPLADKRFPAALRDYCQQWAQQYHVTLELDIADVDLSLTAEEALFRITQEALANVARHSHAHTVRIQLINREAQVLLSVADDGDGFDLEQVENRGIGLHSMHERMEMLHGSLTIISQPGHGTCVNATYTKGHSSRLQGHVSLL
jgi:NarL family two-component system sensor histidine kinase LiaS